MPGKTFGFIFFFFSISNVFQEFYAKVSVVIGGLSPNVKKLLKVSQVNSFLGIKHSVNGEKLCEEIERRVKTCNSEAKMYLKEVFENNDPKNFVLDGVKKAEILGIYLELSGMTSQEFSRIQIPDATPSKVVVTVRGSKKRSSGNLETVPVKRSKVSGRNGREKVDFFICSM